MRAVHTAADSVAYQLGSAPLAALLHKAKQVLTSNLANHLLLDQVDLPFISVRPSRLIEESILEDMSSESEIFYYLLACLPYRDLPIREERISARILKIVNILGNVKNVTVTIFATSIANTLFMIIGIKTISICCISSKVSCSVISGSRIKCVTLSLSSRPVMDTICIRTRETAAYHPNLRRTDSPAVATNAITPEIIRRIPKK